MMTERTKKRLSDMLKESRIKFHKDLCSCLIDKSSISICELDNKTLLEIDLAREFGFFMPSMSAYFFYRAREQLQKRNEFIIKPPMIIPHILYLFYITYIKLKQKTLRKRVVKDQQQ